MIRIDIENIEDIKTEIYLHDAEMVSMRQDMKTQTLELLYAQRYSEIRSKGDRCITRNVALRFQGMVYMELTNYRPWFPSNRVDCIFFESPNLIERLRTIAKEWGSGYTENLPSEEDNLIQPVISYLSGDRLHVLCRSVEYEEIV